MSASSKTKLTVPRREVHPSVRREDQDHGVVRPALRLGPHGRVRHGFRVGQVERGREAVDEVGLVLLDGGDELEGEGGHQRRISFAANGHRLRGFFFPVAAAATAAFSTFAPFFQGEKKALRAPSRLIGEGLVGEKPGLQRHHERVVEILAIRQREAPLAHGAARVCAEGFDVALGSVVELEGRGKSQTLVEVAVRARATRVVTGCRRSLRGAWVSMQRKFETKMASCFLNTQTLVAEVGVFVGFQKCGDGLEAAVSAL